MIAMRDLDFQISREIQIHCSIKERKWNACSFQLHTVFKKTERPSSSVGLEQTSSTAEANAEPGEGETKGERRPGSSPSGGEHK